MSDREPWELPFYKFLDRPEAQRVPRGSILAAPLDRVDAHWLAQWPTPELRALAQVLAAPSSDPREKLIARILTYAALRLRLAGATLESLQALKGKELKAMLRSVGAYAPGNKYGMAAALVNWRDRCRLDGRKAVASANHFRHVRRAVRRGLPVPADVLAEYPSLQERPDDYPLFAALGDD